LYKHTLAFSKYLHKTDFNRGMKRVLILSLLASCVLADDFNFNRRHEYKYSFKGPGLAQGSYQVPFWKLKGDAVASTDQIRLCPSLRDKWGGIFSTRKYGKGDFQVELSFKIHGRGKIGADGLVFWYVQNPNATGNVFGFSPKWKGLGIFLDSYDNDGKRNNPYISIIVNDGTKEYNHQLDGSDTKLGGCLRDFRNRIHPSKLRVTYWNKMLKVEIAPGNTIDEEYEHCELLENIEIPVLSSDDGESGNYFGLTAATGGLADDHDVMSMNTYSLKDANEKDTNMEEEVDPEEAEYQRKMKEFEEEREKYKQEHPELQQTIQQEDVEAASSAELRSVVDIQSQIKNIVQNSLEKMNEMVLRQQEILTKLQQNYDVTVKNDDTKADSDVTLKNSQELGEIVDSIKNTKDSIDQFKQTISELSSNQISLKENIQTIDSRIQSSVKSLLAGNSKDKTREQLDYISSLVLNVQANQKQQPKCECPEQAEQSCLSFSTFLMVALLQVVVYIMYHVIKSSRDEAAKKFY